jgi:hypothetical protein
VNDSKKKRLKLLPEVLPAPPPPSALGPRQRTLNNLGRLAALATAAAALGGCDESGYSVVDPLPAPTRCAGLARTVQAKLTRTTANTLLLELGQTGTRRLWLSERGAPHRRR